jgi:hypothetical protein
MTPNLYAEITPEGIVTRLIMPDSDGNLPPAPNGPNWYAVQWPTHPSSTGERMIREMLADRFPQRIPA